MSDVEETTGKQLGGATGKGFMPGQSGNPNGRPKGSFSLIEILKNKLKETPDGYTKTNAELLVEKMIDLSLKKGNDQQIKNILQYVAGMPKQPIEHSGEVGISILGGSTVPGDDSNSETPTNN